MTLPSNLAAIRAKVRMVTGRPSPTQISDAEIDNYINIFYLNDMPEHLRLINLQTTFQFVTEPFKDVYDFPTGLFLTNSAPVYVAGYKAFFSQSNDEYYRTFPKIQFQQQVATGNGNTVVPLQRQTNFPILRGYQQNPPGAYTATIPSEPYQRITSDIVICAVSGGNTISAVDDGQGHFIGLGVNPPFPSPIPGVSTVYYNNPPAVITGITQAANGVVTAPGHTINIGDQVIFSDVQGMTQINSQVAVVIAITPLVDFTISINTTAFSAYISSGFGWGPFSSFINYVTGQMIMNWGVSIDSGTPIETSVVPYAASRPIAALFFQDQCILRPVPNGCYKVSMDVFKYPTLLFSDSQDPQLREWWQLLAYGAADKIFADNADFENMKNFRPLLQEQMRLVQRRTIVQQASKRSSTIYTQSNIYPTGNFFNGF